MHVTTAWCHHVSRDATMCHSAIQSVISHQIISNSLWRYVPPTLGHSQLHHHLHHFNLSVDIASEHVTTVFHAVVYQLTSRSRPAHRHGTSFKQDQNGWRVTKLSTQITTTVIIITVINNNIWKMFMAYLVAIPFLSASLYFSKRGAYWDRLSRRRWFVVTRVHCGQTVHPKPIVTMEH